MDNATLRLDSLATMQKPFCRPPDTFQDMKSSQADEKLVLQDTFHKSASLTICHVDKSGEAPYIVLTFDGRFPYNDVRHPAREATTMRRRPTEEQLRRSAAFYLRYFRRQIKELQRDPTPLEGTLAFCRGNISAIASLMFTSWRRYTDRSWWNHTWHQVHEDTSVRSRKDDGQLVA